MTISDDCGLQDDQRDGSSNVSNSGVMDSEGVNIKKEWADDVLCSLLSRHSCDVGNDMCRSSRVVERVQEVEDKEFKYNSNTCQQMISKPYVCDVCKKAFSELGNLKTHRHNCTHTGQTPYICDVCNKAFSYRCTLNIHTRTHIGKTPYILDVCSKAFCRLNHLNKHTLVRHRTCVMYVVELLVSWTI